MTDLQIEMQIEEHVNIYNRLLRETSYWLEKNRKQVDENSGLAAYSRGIYYCFMTYQLNLEIYIKHEINNDQPAEIFTILKGRKSIRIFLDIINMFEAQLSNIIDKTEKLKLKLFEKIAPLIESIELNWKEEEIKIKDGLQKKDVIKMIKGKELESSFRFRAIYNLGWIDQQEFNFLEFSWFLRNCMHNDFSALRDKKFEFADVETNELFRIELEKDKIIFMHARLIYGMSRVIAKILDKITELAYEGNPPKINL